MKPIEYCLDSILIALRANWDNFNERKFLNCEILLADMGFVDRYRKHEFFIGLIEKLVNDNNAEFIDHHQRGEKNNIDYYQQNSIITVQGFYLINNGGYTQQRINVDAEHSRLKAIANQTLILTVILALGTVPMALISLADLYWKYNWFRYPFWWAVVGVTILLSALTSYIVYRLLDRKRRRKQTQ